MSDDNTTGGMAWLDLTVPDAAAVAAFYEAVVGWRRSPVSMGDYEDYNMMPPKANAPACGICHARGSNANLPPVWLPYFPVEDVDDAVKQAKERGGEIVDGPREMGEWKMAVVRDPAGACCALLSRITPTP